MVHWFNPENDLALASGLDNYTPPKAARALQNAGAVLPIWYAEPGDSVLCYGVNAEWWDTTVERFGIEVTLFDHNPKPADVPDPWGWSAYARRFFHDEGFQPDALPTPLQIDAMRNLSHRRTAATIATMLRERLPGIKLASPAIEAHSIDQVKEILEKQPRSYIKSPWSSSGRGVVYTGSVSVDRALRMAEDSIRKQGCVMIEKAYDKKIDFARIYRSDGLRCHDLGTSVFVTDDRGAYTGNLLAPEEARFAKVAAECDAEVLKTVLVTLRGILDEVIAPGYTGIFGVDMLIADDGTIDAAVELNLRKTMGYVAMRFTEMYLPQGKTGEFSILPVNKFTDTASEGSEIIQLVPENPNFSIVAKIF